MLPCELTTGGDYQVMENDDLAGAWTTVISPVSQLSVDQSGLPSGYNRWTVALPIGAGKNFFRVEADEAE